jgi:hypothetical protein
LPALLVWRRSGKAIWLPGQCGFWHLPVEVLVGLYWLVLAGLESYLQLPIAEATPPARLQYFGVSGESWGVWRGGPISMSRVFC